MAASKQFWHLTDRRGISEERWSALVGASQDYAVFCNTWFLDAVSEGRWQALIWGDYEAAVPFIYVSKAGLLIALAPLWAMYLGPLGHSLNAAASESLKKILHRRFGVYSLPMGASHTLFRATEVRPTYVLDLSAYSEPGSHHRRHVQKAKKNQLHFIDLLESQVFAEFFWEHRGRLAPGFKDYHQKYLLKLTDEAMKRECGLCCGAASQTGELQAAAFLIRNGTTAYYLDGTSDESGRASGAMFWLIHQAAFLLQAQGVHHLDFCGSRNQGVARFYKGFGAELRHYPLLTGGWLWFLLPGKLRKRFL